MPGLDEARKVSCLDTRVSSWWTSRAFPLGHVEASLNVNEKQLVGSLLDKVLGESIEVELLAGTVSLSPR